MAFLMHKRGFRGRGGRVGVGAAHESLDAFFKFAARQEHPARAGGAHKTYIRAETHDGPLVPAARMGLAQAHNIVQIHFERHGESDYSISRRNAVQRREDVEATVAKKIVGNDADARTAAVRVGVAAR